MFHFICICGTLFSSIYVNSQMSTQWTMIHFSGCVRSKKQKFIFFERLAIIEEKQPFRNIIVIMESNIQFFL